MNPDLLVVCSAFVLTLGSIIWLFWCVLNRQHDLHKQVLQMVMVDSFEKKTKVEAMMERLRRKQAEPKPDPDPMQVDGMLL